MELETRFFKVVENLLGGCDENFVAKFFPTEQKKFLIDWLCVLTQKSRSHECCLIVYWNWEEAF